MISSIRKTVLLISMMTLLSLGACKTEDQKVAADSENQQIAQNEKEEEKISTIDQLQGRWESLDDWKYLVEFSGNTKTDFYDGQVMQETEFEILEECKSGQTVNYVDGEYIDDGEQCHLIELVTDENLFLTNMDRMNLLKFKKSLH